MSETNKEPKPRSIQLFEQDTKVFDSIYELNVQNTITDMMVMVSENSSTVSSQDENDLRVQEKILSHLVEPQKPFQLQEILKPKAEIRQDTYQSTV